MSDSPSQKGWASGSTATLYLLGAIHLGLFAFATGQVPSSSAPFLGFWILGCAVALLLLAMVELRRGEVFTGTIGMVFGGLLGLGAALCIHPVTVDPGYHAYRWLVVSQCWYNTLLAFARCMAYFPVSVWWTDRNRHYIDNPWLGYDWSIPFA